MFLDDETKWRQLAKWIIDIAASCILIFLGVRYISDISGAALWLLDQMATLENSMDFSQLPFGEYLAQIDINWTELGDSLESWLSQLGSSIMNQAGNAVGNAASSLVDLGIGFVFSIYILANKEKLIRQVSRLIRVWIPRRIGSWITHVVSVCGNTFQLFISGQTTEAVILGTLCTLGMLILRLPYAPMIGALVGAKVNLPAMWVLAAITIGGSVAGPLGMLLGVPAMSAIYSLLREATEKVIAVGTKERPTWYPTGNYIWPVYGRITSRFGYRSIFGSYSYHSGLDIAVPYGTSVKASDGGTVTFAGYKGSYGYLVIITHGNGEQTYYGHNSSLLVSAGDKVYQGQTIAKAGSTGRSTGPHLHFEVRVNGQRTNPRGYLP